MNHIYRIVWNASLGKFQAVSELARARGVKSKRSARSSARLSRATALAMAATATMSQAAYADGTFSIYSFVSGTPSSNTGWSWDGTNLNITGPFGYTHGAMISNTGSIGTIINSGNLSGNDQYNGMTNTGTIQVFNNTNGSSLTSFVDGIGNTNSIGTLTNSGTILASQDGVYNTGSIGILTNNASGWISGSNDGIYDAGTIGTLTNAGTITGGQAGVFVANGGSILDGIVNNNGGTIQATINNAADNAIEVSDTGQVLDGIVNHGVITSSGGRGIEVYGTVSGGIANFGSIYGGGHGVEVDEGTSAVNGTLTSNTTSSAVNDGDALYNAGTIQSGSSFGDSSGIRFGHAYVSGNVVNVSDAYIDGHDYGINVQGTATIVGSIVNAGSIVGGVDGIYLGSGSTLTGMLLNQSGGTIHGGTLGVSNNTSITVLSNSGTISGGSTGLANLTGSIGTLSNSGTIASTTLAAIKNTGTITTLTNSDLISGETAGIYNAAGHIGTLSNSGTISSSTLHAVVNTGTISALSNIGTITGTVGIYNSGNLNTLTNGGLISAAQTAILDRSGGTIGSVVNSGVIDGNIYYASTAALTISGGSGATTGTLTGYNDAVGSITSANSDLYFGSGNLVLNDDIAISGYTVYNNAAVLQVNTPLTIAGNYNQGAGATLVIGVADSATSTGSESDTGYGRLIVQGDATVAPGSSITLKSTSGGYGFAAGQRYVVIEATGTGTYNVNSLSYAITGYTGTVTGQSVSVNGDTDLVLTVDSTSPDGTTTTPGSPTSTTTPSTATLTMPATAPNAISAITGITHYTGVSSPALLNLYDAVLADISTASSSTANRIGNQLSPFQTARAAAAPVFNVLSMVNARVDSLRQPGASTASGVSTGDDPMRWSLWGQTFGGHASRNEMDNVPGYSANYGGFMIGADRAFGDRWRLGGVFNYSHTAIDASGDTAGDGAGINSAGLVGYASYTGDRWYLNLSGGVALQHYDTTRMVEMTGFAGAAFSSFNGQQYVARAEAGYPLAMGGITLTPVASVAYSYLNQAGYTETGGNGAALSVDSSSLSSVRSALGAKLSRSFSTSYGALEPELGVQWVHEYDNTRQSVTASFAADTTGETTFSTLGLAPVKDVADVSLGVTLLSRKNLSVSARYELEAGPGYMSNTGVLKLLQRF